MHKHFKIVLYTNDLFYRKTKTNHPNQEMTILVVAGQGHHEEGQDQGRRGHQKQSIRHQGRGKNLKSN